LRFDDFLKPLTQASGAPDLGQPVIRTVIAATVAINLLVLAVPLYINRIYSSVLPQKAGDSLVVITVLLLLVLLLDVILKTSRAWILSWLGAAEEHRLRLGAIRSLLAAPLKASQAEPLNIRLAQVGAAVQLRSLFEQQWLVRRVDLPFALVYLLVLALIGGGLVLVPLILAPLFIWQASAASTRLAGALRQKHRNENACNDLALACLQGASTIKALNLEGFLVHRLEPTQEAMARAAVQQETAMARLQNLSQLFAQWSQLLIVSFGGWMVINQNLSSGALAACTLLSGQVTMPLSKLFTAEAQQAGIALAFEQLTSLGTLPEEPHLLAGDPVPTRGTLSTGALQLPPGGRVLLVGGTPGQSSHWLNSLTGLVGTMPQDLHFDGHAVASMERISLRQRLRLVSNGAPLLRGTVLDHLTQGRPDHLGDRAAALCNLHGVAPQILRLPRGYDSPIGETQDYPLPLGLIFRLQVIQALMDDPAVLLVDASAVALPAEQWQWLWGLTLEASLLVTTATRPADPLPAGARLVSWQGDQLVEVPA
jgi:ATP-binding cassette subfamily C protein LapB